MNKKQEAITKVMKRVFASKDGERVLKYLLDISGYEKSSVVGFDPNKTYYDLGKKDIVKAILNAINVDEKKAIEIARQNYNEVI